MDGLFEIAVITGMFVVRLGIPLLITLGIGVWLRRLDDRWQAEAQARRAIAQAETEKEAAAEIPLQKIIEPPCWVEHNCSTLKMSGCPAHKFPDSPCWLARYRTSGRLPAKCYRCHRFTPITREMRTPVKN